MKTTLKAIKSHDPCDDGWAKILTFLNKQESDDEPLDIKTILEFNGIKDAVWALKAVEGHDKQIRLFAADCAELVLPIFEEKHPNDDRPRKVIQAARDYANGLISYDELAAARAAALAAAWDAASDAAWAASDAAWDKIRDTLLKYL